MQGSQEQLWIPVSCNFCHFGSHIFSNTWLKGSNYIFFYCPQNRQTLSLVLKVPFLLAAPSPLCLPDVLQEKGKSGIHISIIFRCPKLDNTRHANIPDVYFWLAKGSSSLARWTAFAGSCTESFYPAAKLMVHTDAEPQVMITPPVSIRSCSVDSRALLPRVFGASVALLPVNEEQPSFQGEDLSHCSTNTYVFWLKLLHYTSLQPQNLDLMHTVTQSSLCLAFTGWITSFHCIDLIFGSSCSLGSKNRACAWICTHMRFPALWLLWDDLLCSTDELRARISLIALDTHRKAWAGRGVQVVCSVSKHWLYMCPG